MPHLEAQHPVTRSKPNIAKKSPYHHTCLNFNVGYLERLFSFKDHRFVPLCCQKIFPFFCLVKPPSAVFIFTNQTYSFPRRPSPLKQNIFWNDTIIILIIGHRIYLVGGFNPSEKSQSVGMIILNIWKNRKCAKLPSVFLNVTKIIQWGLSNNGVLQIPCFFVIVIPFPFTCNLEVYSTVPVQQDCIPNFQ